MSRRSFQSDMRPRGLPDLPYDASSDDGDLYPQERLLAIRAQRQRAESVEFGSYHDAEPEIHNLEQGDLIDEYPRGRDAYRRRQLASDVDVTDDGLPLPNRRRAGERRHQSLNSDRRTVANAAAVTGDSVTSIRPTLGHITQASPIRRRRHRRNPAWVWQPIVLPPIRQMFEQAIPAWLMAASILGALLILEIVSSGLAIWAPLMLMPVAALYVFSDSQRHPMWRRWSIVLLAAVGIFFPMVIVRQSYLRVPFVEWGNGTLRMPVISTLAVLTLLIVLAFAAAYHSQENPELGGLLFMPVAMLVPFFAGATEITSLKTALVVMAGICAACGFLTIIASMLPAAFPTLVAPIALAIEFLVLPLSKSAPIFPLGAGTFSKFLFFIILATAVGLTIAVPILSVWVKDVRLMVLSGLRDHVSATTT